MDTHWFESSRIRIRFGKTGQAVIALIAFYTLFKTFVEDTSVADPDPGSGMDKKSGSIRDPEWTTRIIFPRGYNIFWG